MNHNNIDWEALARQQGLLRPNGESSSTHEAKRALETILGPQHIADTVDWYVAQKPGRELARTVLQVLSSPNARQRCWTIYTDPHSTRDEKHSALDLLKSFADHTIIPWIEVVLEDQDSSTQNRGANLLEAILLHGDVDPNDAKALLGQALHHPNPYVRDKAIQIRQRLEQLSTAPK